MEAIRKQAAKLREQVARQQQAVLKHLGHVNADAVVVDEEELHCHQKLQDLYSSTKAAKRLQRNIVRGLEGFIATGTKVVEIGLKFAEDFKKYGDENPDANTPLSRIAHHFGTSYKSVEGERETLLGVLSEQVCEPIRTMIYSAPLEDARHLVNHYDRLRQEVEAQATDVLRRKSKLKESDISEEAYMKLKNSESRLVELKSSMKTLGKEATKAMLEVDDQQQNVTYKQLRTLVEAERSYHRNALDILDKLHSEMIAEEEGIESSPKSPPLHLEDSVSHSQEETNSSPQEEVKSNRREKEIKCDPQEGTKSNPKDEMKSSPEEETKSNHQKEIKSSPQEEIKKSNGSDDHHNHQLLSQNDSYFLAKVVHPFDAQAPGELSLAVDDYVIVRQVAGTGWSEGEYKGKAGWFPSAYVEKQEKAPASKIVEANLKQQ
ncbi:SH3 domain-containing protein 1 [Cardamine amara subsp. amara]|uniref:SH3 domain-containing protein 1 n=1 Tax=Cardamine amara subsp. amara TaxID=228776 RepID=A0ABD1AEU9_CARAN